MGGSGSLVALQSEAASSFAKVVNYGDSCDPDADTDSNDELESNNMLCS